MKTKSIVVSSDMKSRRDRKTISIIQDGLEQIIDFLYHEEYLDPEHEIVEVSIHIKSDVPD